VWQRWNQIIVLGDELWLMTATLSRWVGHPECMRRLPRLNESKDGYIERPKFPHLVERQREKFSLYPTNQIRFDSYEPDLHLKTSAVSSSFLIVVPVSVIIAEMTLNLCSRWSNQALFIHS
jgi:hypothetical protein